MNAPVWKDAVVVGAGQAGLAAGWYLRRTGLDFTILDGAERVGATWRGRWPSLRLFTPARYCSLPGHRFPGDPDHYPGKDAVADYLEAYAATHELPVQGSQPVTRLVRATDGEGFDVHTPRGTYRTPRVIVATGPFQRPAVPAWASGLPQGIAQLHSSAYQGPDSLPPGPVLVVGAGNSGVQIASELAASRRTWLAVGGRQRRLPNRVLGRSVFWWLERSGVMDVSVESALGRNARGREFLIGSSPEEVARAHGVRLVPRAEPRTFSRGPARCVTTVIWATGFRSDFGWVDVPVLDATGRPLHRRGATSIPGLGFLGLPWLHTRGSALLGWVGRDAEHLVDHLTRSFQRRRYVA